MQIVKKSFKSAGLCLAAALIAGSAHAAVIFSPTIPATATVENVRFNVTQPGVAIGPATTVTGRAARTGYLIDFSADELLIAFENPAALPTPVPPTVRATDSALRSLDIDVRDGAFTTVFYNLFLGPTTGNPAGRFANILVTAFDGTTSTFQQVLRNGNNVLTITTDNATLLRDVSIFSNTDIADIRQIRFGGLQDAPIPEPSILMSFSLAGFALWRVCTRRRGGPRAGAGHHFAQA